MVIMAGGEQNRPAPKDNPCSIFLGVDLVRSEWVGLRTHRYTHLSCRLASFLEHKGELALLKKSQKQLCIIYCNV